MALPVEDPELLAVLAVLRELPIGIVGQSVSAMQKRRRQVAERALLDAMEGGIARLYPECRPILERAFARVQAW